MAEHLSHEVTQLLAEPDGGSRQEGVNALVRARLFVSIADGLEESNQAGAAGCGDRMRLAALLDGGLPPTERDAMLAALTQDPIGRAELSSAAELVDAVDGTPHTVPPHLLARAVETFSREPLRDRPATALWPPARLRWLSSRRAVLRLAAVSLVAVATPAVWLAIGDRSNQSSDQIERGLSESGTGKTAAPEQRPAAPATSCGDKGATAQPGEAGKPERTEKTSAPADDPCQPKSPMSDGRATAPPPGTRN